MKSEYWATKKQINLLLGIGLVFIFIFPLYGILKLGTSNIAIIFAIFFAAIPGVYFINCARKLKKAPIVVLTPTLIVVNDPFARKKETELSSITSVKKDINGGIVLKQKGFLKSTRINGKSLSPEDRESLYEYFSKLCNS